tara:strand:- start:760 stop:936 length:177 start_codon:yes stop_codon:yes gene_type:complete
MVLTPQMARTACLVIFDLVVSMMKTSGQIARPTAQDMSQKEKIGEEELYINLNHVECI